MRIKYIFCAADGIKEPEHLKILWCAFNWYRRADLAISVNSVIYPD